ncbi:MAG: hypothetical protein M3Y35_15665, partial [Actinomycetota bacterium]|nr:hypothetical protein [Actinomycetota bacterium]
MPKLATNAAENQLNISLGLSGEALDESPLGSAATHASQVLPFVQQPSQRGETATTEGADLAAGHLGLPGNLPDFAQNLYDSGVFAQKVAAA